MFCVKGLAFECASNARQGTCGRVQGHGGLGLDNVLVPVFASWTDVTQWIALRTSRTHARTHACRLTYGFNGEWEVPEQSSHAIIDRGVDLQRVAE